MSGDQIAREVADALREVAAEVGDGTFLVTLRVVTGEPVNPWDTDTSASQNFEVPAMVSDYPRDMIDGTLIRATDKRVLIAAENGTVPTTSMIAVISGVEHTIVSVDELAPSGVALYYECQCRK